MYHHMHLNVPERREWQNPESILADIGLKVGFTFIDVGCGDGFFTLPAARIVGETGKVYGIDTNAESINELKELADKENLNNLELTAGRAEDIIPCISCADIVFFGIVFHDFDDPTRVLQNVKKMLNSTGRLINVDWKKKEMKFGPPLRKKFSENKAAQMIEAAGFEVLRIENAGPYHYMIVARLKIAPSA